MATCTWTGGDNSFTWTALKNWDIAVPTEDDDIIIPAAARFNFPIAPAGTRVKRLRLEGGGLSTRLTVNDRFEWLGGTLEAGIDLGMAELIVSGDGGQGSRGHITSGKTTFKGAVVALSEGARFTNNGTLTSSGNCRIWWAASATPFLDNQGALTVSDGEFVVDNVIGRLAVGLRIEPGASLVIKNSTIPCYLLAGTTVSGGGRLLVGRGGRLYAVDTASIAAGSSLELAVDGSIEDSRTAILYEGIVGPMPASQQLTVEGRLLWTGGAIYGNVLLGARAVLQMEGSELHQHVGGTMRLGGSGIMAGPGKLDVDIAILRNDGDLLVQSDVDIDTGRDYEYDNRGTIRTSGTPQVRLGDNEMRSRGTIEVTEGVLRMGPLNLLPQSTLTTHLHSADPGVHGEVISSGQVLAAGAVNVVADGYVPAAGESLDLLTGGPGTILAGRFVTAKFPAPIGGRYLYVSYAADRVRLRVGANTVGFDLRDPPPAALLAAWAGGGSPYGWVGYYLRSPCHSASWMGMRTALAGLGYGMAILYVGQQTPGASACVSNVTTDTQGAADAVDAIAKTTAEGFAAGTWIYLDVEKNPAGPPTAGMLAYVRAWVDIVLADRRYNPGLYLHQSEVAVFDPIVTSAFQAAGRADRARYWVVGGPALVALSDPPTKSTVPEATTWQQTLDVTRTHSGFTTKIDVNVCALIDPSTP